MGKYCKHHNVPCEQPLLFANGAILGGDSNALAWHIAAPTILTVLPPLTPQLHPRCSFFLQREAHFISEPQKVSF